MKYTCQKNGFTLIELLVVISIISLLSSVVLGAMTGARKKALDTQRNQIVEEYTKALALVYTDNSGYPSSGILNDYTAYCLGNTTSCLDSNTPRYPNSTINNLVGNYMPSLPILKTVTYSMGGVNNTFDGPIYQCLQYTAGKCGRAAINWMLELDGPSTNFTGLQGASCSNTNSPPWVTGTGASCTLFLN